MEYPKFTVSNQKEESFSVQRVKRVKVAVTTIDMTYKVKVVCFVNCCCFLEVSFVDPDQAAPYGGHTT